MATAPAMMTATRDPRRLGSASGVDKGPPGDRPEQRTHGETDRGAEDDRADQAGDGRVLRVAGPERDRGAERGRRDERERTVGVRNQARVDRDDGGEGDE